MGKRIVKFSEARDFEELKRMLDEYLVRGARAKLGQTYNAPITFTGRCSSPIRFGALIQATSEGMVRLADASTANGAGRAHGIVVRVLSADTVEWAPEADLWLTLGDAAHAGIEEVYLGRNGGILTTAPATSGWWLQKTGRRISYDAQNGLHHLHMRPDLDGGTPLP